jgi:hypothetical protein
MFKHAVSLYEKILIFAQQILGSDYQLDLAGFSLK